jgi:hypothetical protein
LSDERRERLLTISTVEVVNKLGNVFVDRSGRFEGWIIISSPADEVLKASSFTAAVEDFGNFVFRRILNENGWWRFEDLTRERIVSSEVQLVNVKHIVYCKRVGKVESVRVRA